MRHDQESIASDTGEWAHGIRAGDIGAFEALFRAYYARLCTFVRAHVGSVDVAEEIVQETFLNVWQGRGRLDPAQSLTAYLYRAARNGALNELKHRSVEQRWAQSAALRPSSDDRSTDDDVRVHELGAALDRALDRLPERCRLVFLLSREHGLSYQEIAETLSISIKTVETQMGRALKALRSSLAGFL